MNEAAERLRAVIEFSQIEQTAEAQRALHRLLRPLPGFMQPADEGKADAAEIQKETLALLRAAMTGARYRVNLQITRQIWRDPRIKKGAVLLSTSSTSTRDLWLHRVLELLERVGVDKVRVGPEDVCGRIFVKVTRKEFCSKQCQSRAWMRQDRAKQQTTGESHATKKTRSRGR